MQEHQEVLLKYDKEVLVLEEMSNQLSLQDVCMLMRNDQTSLSACSSKLYVISIVAQGPPLLLYFKPGSLMQLTFNCNVNLRC